MKQLILWASLLMLSASPLFAQTEELPQLLGNYTREDAKTYCWTVNDYDPNVTYPEEWNEQSAICLRAEQRYYLYDADYKNTVVGFLAHTRYKLLDEAAVEEYSEIYYSDYECSEYFNSCVNEVGIRIIKPDGTIVEVKDAEIIPMDKNKNKVAIPTLEVGDVLDYYVFRYLDYSDALLGKYSEFDRNLIQSEYPIKEYRYSMVTNANWKMTFSSGEHDLNFNQRVLDAVPTHGKEKSSSSNKKRKQEEPEQERFYEYYIVQTDVAPVESTRWNYYYRTTPYLKLMMLPDEDYMYGVADTSKDWWEEEAETKYLKDKHYNWLNAYGAYRTGYSQFNRYMKKKYGRKVEVSDSKWAEEWYYFVRYYFTNKEYIAHRQSGAHGDGAESYRSLTEENFVRYMVYGLTRRKIKHDLVFVEYRHEGRLQDIIHVGELDLLLRIHAEDGKMLYAYRPNPYTHFNELPYMAESTTAYTVEKRGNPFNKAYVSSFSLGEAILPTSEYQQNRFYVKTNINLDQEDPTVLQTSNEFIVTGHQRYDYKYPVVDWIDMMKKEYENYGEANYLRKYENSANFATFRASEEKDRAERVKSVVAEHFEAEEDKVELGEYSVLSSANSPGEDSLHFKIDCDLEGFVKKVGPNYLLQLGKLVGGQLLLKDKDLEARTVDVYMPYPRSYEYEIVIQIPEDYEVKGLDKFSNSVDNETGTLISDAVLEGNTIKMTFVKHYKSNFEPKENWSKMAEFIQPGAQFVTEEVLLKKKRT